MTVQKILLRYSSERNIFRKDEDEEVYKDFLSEILPIIHQHKQQLWPKVYRSVYQAYPHNREYEKACQQGRELYTFEPKYSPLNKIPKNIGSIARWRNGDDFTCN